MKVQRQFDRRTFNAQEATPPFGGTDCKKLRDADTMLDSGKSVGESFQSLEICEATLCRWRTQYDGMKSGQAKRLKQLELKNGTVD